MKSIRHFMSFQMIAALQAISHLSAGGADASADVHDLVTQAS